MGIGERKQIKLVQITPAKGVEGNWSTSTESSFNTWAEVSNVNTSRDYANGQTSLGQTKRFKTRFRFDQYPGADWKVMYEGREWVVASVVRENEKRFYWMVTANAK